MTEIVWLGDSLEIVRGYRVAIRRAIGSELRLLQTGDKPVHARPLKTVGRGVWELKISEQTGQFRVIYVIQRRDRIYVLHAFQKKTQRTPQKDIDLARARFREI
jgi:phage-related protein